MYVMCVYIIIDARFSGACRIATLTEEKNAGKWDSGEANKLARMWVVECAANLCLCQAAFQDVGISPQSHALVVPTAINNARSTQAKRSKASKHKEGRSYVRNSSENQLGIYFTNDDAT